MKKYFKAIALLAIIYMFFFINVKAQAVDSVCVGTTGKNYYVTATAGSTYNWTINGGTKASGGNTASITIDFDSTAGVDTIYVVETDSNGCIGDQVALAIVRLPKPSAVISGTSEICYNDSTGISVALSGNGPWTFSYSDGSNTTQISNHSSSTYNFSTGLLTPAATTTYTLITATDQFGCSASGSGSAAITVNPKPTTSQIFH